MGEPNLHPSLPHSTIGQEVLGVLDHLSIAIIECSLTGEIILANKMAYSFFNNLEAGNSIDSYIDFGKSERFKKSSFSELMDHIQHESTTHRILWVAHESETIHWLKITFNLQTAHQPTTVALEIIDGTDLKRIDETNAYKHNLLQSILHHSKEAFVVFGEEGQIEMFSPSAQRVFGYTSMEVAMEDIFVLFAETSVDNAEKLFDKCVGDASFSLSSYDVDCVNSNGDIFPASTVWAKLDSASIPLYMLTINDVSLLKKFMNSIHDAYLRIDEAGVILDVNKKTELLFGHGKLELVGQTLEKLQLFSIAGECQTTSKKTYSPLSMIHDINNKQDKIHEEVVAIDSSGQEISLQVTTWPQETEAGRLYNLIFRDITLKKVHEEKLRESAYTDSLTRLGNRAFFLKTLEEKINSCHQHGNQLWLILIDLDKFKVINDTLGHDYGDELLTQVADRLTACVREQDTVCRIGGDEFTVLVDNVHSDDQIQHVAERVLASFSEEFIIKDKPFTMSGSIGLASYPNQTNDAEDLVKSADIAMYEAKAKGKNAYLFFSNELRRRQSRRLLIEKRLKNAIANGELHLEYQPKVLAPQMNIIGIEALARWETEELGSISPVEFIPIAEDTGYIIELSRWVFKESFHQFKQWHRTSAIARKYLNNISVNVSALHFNANLPGDLIDIIEKEDIAPSMIELEITESAVMKDSQRCITLLNELRSAGINISIDDFGTGYSSLRYLKQLPFDTLKIDRAFINGISTDQRQQFVVEAVISIVNKLNLNVVAEGVEKKEDVTRLIEMGCMGFQGFYFSRPLPADGVLPFILENTKGV